MANKRPAERPKAEPLARVIGHNIAKARRWMQYSQAELAAELALAGLNWTGVTVAKVETGTREVTIGELVALGQVLGRTPAELLATQAPVLLGKTDRWVPPGYVEAWVTGRTVWPEEVAAWEAAEADGAARVAQTLSGTLSTSRADSELPKRLDQPDREQFLEEARLAAKVHLRVENELFGWQLEQIAEDHPPSPRQLIGKRASLWQKISKEEGLQR
jgi:hypothetical protein